ncbi:MAG TPA: class I SAM-dependent methyltransferase, partial [Leptospiraceae bacterium]|nr:class I SAM-dependent methyltransferase [Leptospiraceae bacterium]
EWWNEKHFHSEYGIPQIRKAIEFVSEPGKVLDIGCGAGGRFIRLFESRNYTITAIDVSSKMIDLAKLNHPNHRFINQDICQWETDEKFNLIVAWDSIFHLPLSMQKPVLAKLCSLLEKNGVLVYTFGNAEGDHLYEWHGDHFYYSSVGINENIQILMKNGLTILHLELDQYPEKHVYTIAKKISD